MGQPGDTENVVIVSTGRKTLRCFGGQVSGTGPGAPLIPSRGFCRSEITTLIQWLYFVSGPLGGPNSTISIISLTGLSEIIRLQAPVLVRAVGLSVDQCWEVGRRVHRAAFRYQVGGS